MIAAPPAALLAQDNLTLLWGNASGFTEVSQLSPTSYQETMDPTTGNMQIKIQATFSEQGTPKTRQITVNVPRGYMIKEYVAKSGTTPISGVTQLSLGANDVYLSSSVLTASDGSPFADQLIPGYTGWNVAEGANADYRPYDGKVVYTFSQNCGYIELTLTLNIDVSLVPHTNTANATGTAPSLLTQYTLPDITVEMISGSAAPLVDRVRVLMTNLTAPRIGTANAAFANNGHTAQAAGVVDAVDPNKGTCDFNTGWGFASFNSTYGQQSQYIDGAIITISYPAGVTYKGFLTENSWNTNQNNNPSNGTYLNGHLTVNNDPVNRKVTFTFNKILWDLIPSLNTGLQVFWSAVVDNTTIKWNQNLNFNALATFTSGSLIPGGPVYTLSQAAITTTRTPVKPSVNLSVAPTNRTRRDLNAPTDDFPYGWAIGQFNITNSGPSVPTNVTYQFTFPASPMITGVRIPCTAGTTDENVTVTGLTSKGRQLTYSFNLGSVRYNNQPLQNATSAGITAQMLEEDTAAGEFLVNLTIVQPTLQLANYLTGYVNLQTTYYGKFTNGKEGDVKLTLSADGFGPITATDHTTIGWLNNGAGTMQTITSHKGYPALSTNTLQTGDYLGGSFYPGDPVYFEANISTGNLMQGVHCNGIIDPVMYINLPVGITLNPSTIQVLSAAGKNGPKFVPATVTATKTQTINGVMWTSYRVQVNNKYDIIARGINNMNMNMTNPVPGSGLAAIYTNATFFTLRFTAHVDIDASPYPAIAMDDVLYLDPGQNAVNATGDVSYITPDVNNWLGKGTSYGVMAAVNANVSPNFSIQQNAGLNVYLGIRAYGSPNDFYYYDGTPNTIAALSSSNMAELRIKYQNTSPDVYYAGTEIYLPIPTANVMYDHYFNNTERDTPDDVEATGSANAAPLWTARLASEAILPGFTTEYGVSMSPTTNYLVPVTNSWEPVSMQWYDYAGLLAAGYTLADVTFIEFEASQDISPGTTGEAVLLLDVAPGAKIGDINFWRAYEKGWQTPDGGGNWLYSSVVAAMPAVMGVIGKFFFDANRNGAQDAGEAYTAAAPMPSGFTAALSGTGITGNLPMTIDAEGNFQSLNPDGSIYYLLQGDYTVTFTNASPTLYHFSNVTPVTRSYIVPPDTYVWYNDIQQGSILHDNTSAIYSFQVTDTGLNIVLIGVALKNSPQFIPVNPQVRGWVK